MDEHQSRLPGGHNKRESQKKKKWMMHWTKEMDDLLKENG
jgi:hypothetical protein